MPINIVSEMHTGTLPDVNSTQLFFMDVERFLDSLPQEPIFDLVVTSPPYNIGKEYENQVPLTDYVAWQKRIIEKICVPPMVLIQQQKNACCYFTGRATALHPH